MCLRKHICVAVYTTVPIYRVLCYICSRLSAAGTQAAVNTCCWDTNRLASALCAIIVPYHEHIFNILENDEF